MEPVVLTSYVAIIFGGLAGSLALAIVGRAFLERRAAKAEPPAVMRPTLILLGAALLFVFGGGYGLQGLTTASSVLVDLAEVIRGDPGSDQQRSSTERLVGAAARGDLSDDQQELLRAAVLENPHEDVDKLLSAAGTAAATPELKKRLDGLRADLKRRVDTAVGAAEASKPGVAPIDAVKALPPETLRYLRIAPDESLQKVRVDRRTVRELSRSR